MVKKKLYFSHYGISDSYNRYNPYTRIKMIYDDVLKTIDYLPLPVHNYTLHTVCIDDNGPWMGFNQLKLQCKTSNKQYVIDFLSDDYYGIIEYRGYIFQNVWICDQIDGLVEFINNLKANKIL